MVVGVTSNKCFDKDRNWNERVREVGMNVEREPTEWTNRAVMKFKMYRSLF